MSTSNLRLTEAGARRVRAGHPWVFADDVERARGDDAPGALAALYDRKGRWLGVAIDDPGSPIRARVLSRDRVTLDTAFFAERIAAAVARRAPFPPPDTTGWRVLAGASDATPGIVLDRYAAVGVLRIDTAGWIPHLPAITEAAAERLTLSHVVVRWPHRLAAAATAAGVGDGTALRGGALPDDLTFLENGLRFGVDPVRGQKTGFFLDQRDNRARVRARASGARVLNLFAYTGGFSLAAAAGGAREVHSVDIAAPALACAEANFALNTDRAEVAACRHRTFAVDVFDAIDGWARDNEVYDIVVVDPPSLARKAADVDAAHRAYERLARASAPLVRRGGLLVFASCTRRISADDLESAMTRGLQRAGRRWRVEERTGHAVDHPIGHPEAAYLKCLFTRLDA